MPPSQHRSSPLLKRLDHDPRNLRRRSLTQRAVDRTREPHLQHQVDLRPRTARSTRGPFLRRPPIRRRRLERKLLERPPRQQRREDRPVPRRPLRIIARVVALFRVLVVVRQFAPRDRGFRVPGHGFEDGVGQAVDGAAEQFVVGPVADAEVCGPGPSMLLLAAVVGCAGGGGGGVGGREGGYGAGGAVGDEGWVGDDVSDDVV